jgi:hypothetical protein
MPTAKKLGRVTERPHRNSEGKDVLLYFFTFTFTFLVTYMQALGELSEKKQP